MSSKTQSAGGTHQVGQHLETFLLTIDSSGPNTNLEWSRLDLWTTMILFYTYFKNEFLYFHVYHHLNFNSTTNPKRPELASLIVHKPGCSSIQLCILSCQLFGPGSRTITKEQLIHWLNSPYVLKALCLWRICAWPWRAMSYRGNVSRKNIDHVKLFHFTSSAGSGHYIVGCSANARPNPITSLYVSISCRLTILTRKLCPLSSTDHKLIVQSRTSKFTSR